MSNTQEQVRADGAGATAVSNRDVVRLSVNLANDVAGALKTLSTSQGVSVTEGVRRAIALWKLVSDELSKGNKIMVVEGEGDNAKFRELILL
ncbi:hypothetical protein [Phycicoccus sp. Soil748]|uniref:hypothetical protein n=1 Tax=Phycicoccus sp. Soil748 TaxID=1736397 RepID=UPI0007027EF8|nr:hypothetical protein [Phycicoccus sp. Soil748]KRE54700.1 hypothetical protein ASG70_11155 [Phycicoccus sp. Soil748]